MRKVKNILFLLLLILIISTSAAFSIFYLDGSHNQTNSSNEIGVGFDNIEENYKLDGYGVESDWYTVFFYSQPRYALEYEGFNSKTGIVYEPLNKNPSNEKWNINSKYPNKGYKNRFCFGMYGRYDGYWKNLSGNSALLPQKIERVYKNVNYDTLSSLGTPGLDMKDQGNYPMRFTGWTTNIYSAASLGYGGQGEYNLFDFQTPLSVIDRTLPSGELIPIEEVENHLGELAIDGSYIGDLCVNVFALYSSGKDYGDIDPDEDSELEKNRVNCVEIIDSKGVPGRAQYDRFLSHVKNNNDDILDDYYVIRTVPIQDDIISNYSISLAPVTEHGWTGANFGHDKLKNIVPLHSDGTTKGVYNIYVYILNEFELSGYGKNYDNIINSIPNKSNYVPDCLSNIKILENGSHYTNFEFKGDPNFWGSRKTYKASAWVYVERVYEYKVLGGASNTFDYYDSLNPYLYYENNKNDNNLISNNISYNDIEYTFTHEYNGNLNIFKRNVFTVAAADTNIDYQVLVDPTPTDGYKGSELIEQAQLASSSELLDGDYYVKGSDGVDYTTKLLKFKNPGNYNIRIRVEFNASNIAKIYVSAKESPTKFFVKVYDEGTKLSIDQNGFVIHNTVTPKFEAINVQLGLKLNQLEFKDQNGTTYTVKDILDMGYVFRSHATNRILNEEMLSKFVISKNYIFYLEKI